MIEEGSGGGETTALLPPILTFPHQGGKGPLPPLVRRERGFKGASAAAYVCGDGWRTERIECNMRVFTLIICIGLLTCLLSTSLMGCGIGRPPVQSLGQWEAERNRVRSRE
jgi:hypothetical protein